MILVFVEDGVSNFASMVFASGIEIRIIKLHKIIKITGKKNK